MISFYESTSNYLLRTPLWKYNGDNYTNFNLFLTYANALNLNRENTYILYYQFQEMFFIKLTFSLINNLSINTEKISTETCTEQEFENPSIDHDQQVDHPYTYMCTTLI